jgi:hypothetical protein
MSKSESRSTRRHPGLAVGALVEAKAKNFFADMDALLKES